MLVWDECNSQSNFHDLWGKEWCPSGASEPPEMIAPDPPDTNRPLIGLASSMAATYSPQVHTTKLTYSYISEKGITSSRLHNLEGICRIPCSQKNLAAISNIQVAASSCPRVVFAWTKSHKTCERRVQSARIKLTNLHESNSKITQDPDLLGATHNVWGLSFRHLRHEQSDPMGFQWVLTSKIWRLGQANKMVWCWQSGQYIHWNKIDAWGSPNSSTWMGKQSCSGMAWYSGGLPSPLGPTRMSRPQKQRVDRKPIN